MTHREKTALLFGIIVSAVWLCALFAFVPQAVTAADKIPQGGTFKVAVIDDPKIWPIQGGIFNILVNKAVYSTLVRYHYENLTPTGDLAESWDLSPDGKIYTFNLRKNVKWHDGHPFTAKDVAFTFNTWLNPKIPYYLRRFVTGVEGIEIVDDHTIKVKLKAPASSFPALLAYLMNILPEHLLNKLSPSEMITPTEFLKNPIGTGPFKFDSRVPGSHVKLVANEDYYLGRPHLDSFIFKIIPNKETQLAQLRTGELDFVEIEPTQIDDLKKASHIDINSAKMVKYTYYAVNNQDPLFRDVRVRRAMMHAIDRKTIRDTVMAGRAQICTGVIAPILDWVHNPDVQRYDYDPKKAEALLAEAGWKKGSDGILTKDGKKMSFVFVLDPGNPVREQLSLYAQQSWKKIGMDVKLEYYEYGVILKRIRNKPPKYQANINWYIHPATPDLSAYYATGAGSNTFNYSNPEVDRLFDEGRKTADRQKQVEIYGKIQKIMADDLPVLFLFYPDEIRAINKRIGGFANVGYRDAYAWCHRIFIKK